MYFTRCYVAFHFGLKTVRVIYCTFYGELCGARRSVAIAEYYGAEYCGACLLSVACYRVAIA